MLTYNNQIYQTNNTIFTNVNLPYKKNRLILCSASQNTGEIAEKSTQNALKNALKLQIFSSAAPIGTAGKYFKI